MRVLLSSYYRLAPLLPRFPRSRFPELRIAPAATVALAGRGKDTPIGGGTTMEFFEERNDGGAEAREERRAEGGGKVGQEDPRSPLTFGAANYKPRH